MSLYGDHGISPTTSFPLYRYPYKYDSIMVEFRKFDKMQDIKVLAFNLKKGLISEVETIVGLGGTAEVVEFDVIRKILAYVRIYPSNTRVWFVNTTTDYAAIYSLLRFHNLELPRELRHAMCYDTVMAFNNHLTNPNEDIKTKVKNLIKVHSHASISRRILKFFKLHT